MHRNHYPTPTTSIDRSYHSRYDGRELAEMTREQSHALWERSRLLRQRSQALREQVYRLLHLSQRLCQSKGQAEA